MKYLKTDECWIVLETGEKIQYGNVAIDYYHTTKKLMDQYKDELFKISPLHKTGQEYEKAVNELKNKYGFDAYSYEDTDFFMNILELYFSEDAKIETDKKESENEYSIKTDYSCSRELVKENGWRDFPDNHIVPFLDVYFLKALSNTEIKHTLHYYNYEWYPAYDTNDHLTNVIVVFMDVMQMRKYNYHFRYCRHCGNLFLQKKLKNKYCLDCSKQYKRIKDKERQDTPRGLHKRIYNYMSNSCKFEQEEIDCFMNESNYYWDIINDGKEPKINQHYQNIPTNEDEYSNWLSKKQAEFKSIAKTRKIKPS